MNMIQRYVHPRMFCFSGGVWRPTGTAVSGDLLSSLLDPDGRCTQ
jgi:hypothetical protein